MFNNALIKNALDAFINRNIIINYINNINNNIIINRMIWENIHFPL